MTHDLIYTRAEVLALGVEARCVGPDGARYIWHAGVAVKVDRRTCTTAVVTDPDKLPEGPWFLTKTGLRRLEEG